jgi:hypothetical protein
VGIDKHILSLIFSKSFFRCKNPQHNHKLSETTFFRLQEKYGNIFQKFVLVLCAMTVGKAQINIRNEIYARENIFKNAYHSIKGYVTQRGVRKIVTLCYGEDGKLMIYSQGWGMINCYVIRNGTRCTDIEGIVLAVTIWCRQVIMLCLL